MQRSAHNPYEGDSLTWQGERVFGCTPCNNDATLVDDGQFGRGLQGRVTSAPVGNAMSWLHVFVI